MERGIKNVTGFIHKDQRSLVSGVLNNLHIALAGVNFSLSAHLTFYWRGFPVLLYFYCTFYETSDNYLSLNACFLVNFIGQMLRENWGRINLC